MTRTERLNFEQAKTFVAGFCAGIVVMGIVVALMATLGLIRWIEGIGI